MDTPPALFPLQQGRPTVVPWYKAYLGFMLFMFLFVAVSGLFFFIPGLMTAEDMDGLPPQVVGALYVGMGLLFSIPCIVGFFLRRSKGTWIFHLVMICIGMSGCTIVFSIPLLIFWIKPEVKAWYFADR